MLYLTEKFMPDQPGEQPPGAVAGEEQPEISPAEPNSHDLPAPSQTGLSRFQLRAAIRSVYRSPHPDLAPEPAPELEPEIPPNPYGEEFSQPEGPASPVEEYSIPAPAEFSPREEKPGNPTPKEPLETSPEDSFPRKEVVLPQPADEVFFEVPFEETDPNPALAEEPTLSTIALETFAHAPEPEETPKAEVKVPREDELVRAAKAQVLIAKARLQARQGQFELARKLFGQAITQDPTNAEAWTWLGGLLAEINLERAKVCLTRALELDAANERANRGLAEVNKRLEERARQQAEEAQRQDESSASRAIVLARPEIKIGLEEVIDRQRQKGIEPDPESIPLGGARFGPAIESGELKLVQYGRPRLGKVPVAIGLVVLVGIIVALIWLGPLSHGASEGPASAAFAGITGQPGSNLPGNPVQTQVAAASQGAPVTSDEAFALKIRLEIDKYNRFFLTAHNLRSQVQGGEITWENYSKSSKQLQADIKAEKKPLDNLAVETTPNLIQSYRELQNIASITNNAIDFTVSGIDNTSPEDLEEGNRQFNDAARHLTDLLGLLNRQVPLTGPTPNSNIETPAATLPVPSDTVPATAFAGTPLPTPTERPIIPTATPGRKPTPTPTP
jgi:tetratricopeptide (TPR) repeat protein